MKKLLVLVQSLFIPVTVVSPVLLVSQNKEVVFSQEIKVVDSSIDVVDLTNLKNASVALPNLNELLNDHSGKGESIAAITATFTTPDGFLLEYNLRDVIWTLELLFLRGNSFVFHDSSLSVFLDYKVNIGASYWTGEWDLSTGLGSWNLEEIFNKVLTKDVQFKYSIEFQ